VSAGESAVPRRLQKPTPPGVSRTSAGQQAPEGSPSDIRDRLPKIDSDSSELAQPAFPTSSQLPRAGRSSSRHGVIAIDGEHSCAACGRRDRIATVAIARRGALGVIARLAAGGVVVRPFSHVRTAGAAPGLRTPDSDQIGRGRPMPGLQVAECRAFAPAWLRPFAAVNSPWLRFPG
jgi:hypothetical protein